MFSTLIVIIFPDENRAENVFHALSAMRRRELYNLEETMLVKRSSGDVTFQQLGASGQTGAAGEETKANAVASLAHLILEHAASEAESDMPAEVELEHVGIDQYFVSAVAHSLNSEFSALFFLIRADSMGDATELSNVLSLFRGKTARTTLSSHAQSYLTSLSD
jgi:uncharacterized membrane protein